MACILHKTIQRRGLHPSLRYCPSARHRGSATRAKNATKPVFSPDGRFLLFISSRRPAVVQSDSQRDFVTTFSTGLYAAVLRKDDTAPEVAGGPAATSSSKPSFRIDLDDLMQRVVPLPASAANISDLVVRGSHVFYQADPVATLAGPLPGARSSLHLLDLTKGDDTVLVNDLANFTVSGDGQPGAVCHGCGRVACFAVLDRSTTKTSFFPLPAYRSAWRHFRSGATCSKIPGAWIATCSCSWTWTGATGQMCVGPMKPICRCCGRQSDMTYLLQQLQGELSSSHMVVSPADGDKVQAVAEARPIGADLALDASSGRYRLAHVYRGR